MLLENKRIYYVEDNDSNRFIVQLALERHGAILAYDRRGSYDTILRMKAFAPIDLILLDLMLAHSMDGYAVLERVRKEPEFEKTPIVAISAADPAIEIPKAKEKGFNGFISKPISGMLLAKQIAQLLEGQPLWE
ncbi:MAG: response regulator [Anaerolineae bacterium]